MNNTPQNNTNPPMFDLHDYFARYLKHLEKCKSVREAWEKTENDWEFWHKNNSKYSSYEAFRVGKHRYFSIKSNRT